jgi:hypothetical protein
VESNHEVLRTVAKVMVGFQPTGRGGLGGGIALLVFGLLWIVFVGIGFSVCVSSPVGGAGGCAALGFFLIIGIFLMIGGIALIARSQQGARSPPLPYNPAVPPPIVSPVVVQQTVVKVRCRFCGALADPAVGKCPSCGAPL